MAEVTGRPRTWSDGDVARVMRMLQSGMRYREIALKLNMSLGKVQRIIAAGGKRG